jgi:hypothetical protein
MRDRLRSLIDVYIFIRKTLYPINKYLFLISAILLIFTVVSLVSDLFSGAWLVVIFAFLAIGKDFFLFIWRWFKSPDAILLDDDEIPQLLSSLQLTSDYQGAGYKIRVLNLPNEYVVRSSEVDLFLRKNDVELQENLQLIDPINEIMGKNSKVLEDALRCQYRKSWGAHPPQRFVNEKKVCLGQDLFLYTGKLLVYKGGYFHTFLTNELVSHMLETRGPRPTISYRGSQHFPAEPNGEGSTRYLKRINGSFMANHIGVSTIVHTSDGQLVLWRQSGRAQQSRNLLAPTGSGSCDWSDWTSLSSNRSLKTLIIRAMEREFREESHPFKSALRGVAIRTSVLGFFRWVRRGGKPEFVGISKTEASLSELEPHVAEVEAPERIRLVYPASTFNQLKDSVNSLLDDNRLSVPLWVIVKCLDEALEKDSDSLAKFLEIS